jgi:Sec-independent protein translocase protein TatA
MLRRPTMFAFLPSLGFQEMSVLVVISLLLYGRDLPQAGRMLGKAVANLRRGFE